jgi:hypothetical protein
MAHRAWAWFHAEAKEKVNEVGDIEKQDFNQ